VAGCGDLNAGSKAAPQSDDREQLDDAHQDDGPQQSGHGRRDARPVRRGDVDVAEPSGRHQSDGGDENRHGEVSADPMHRSPDQFLNRYS